MFAPALLLMLSLFSWSPAQAASAPCPPALDFTVTPLGGGEPVHLCEKYAGQVLLVVNTASYCGFTPQYKGLEALYRQYRARGFQVLGFPSNDFGAQEPGNEAQIKDFCERTYQVKFPMFGKARVIEPGATPLFQTLARESGGYPQWNFHKYLIDREGKVIGGFGSKVEPGAAVLREQIETALLAGKPVRK